jgi:hypothetical protein
MFCFKKTITCPEIMHNAVMYMYVSGVVQLSFDPKYFNVRSIPTEAMNEAFLPKRTPVTNPE